jgi:hypothetical protein
MAIAYSYYPVNPKSAQFASFLHVRNLTEYSSIRNMQMKKEQKDPRPVAGGLLQRMNWCKVPQS